MQKIVRKVYLSIMVSVVCMITLVTVTFAWVGFLDFTKFDNFDINLNVEELEEYGIEISLTGEEGSFGTSVNPLELKRIILKNYSSTLDVDNMTDEQIQSRFSTVSLKQCTVKPNADNSFPDFLDMHNKVTTKYFKFDLYLSSYKAYESDETSDFLMDVFLSGNLLEGTKDTRNLVNDFTYPSDFVNNVINGIQANTNISKNITVDSSSACRVAIQKYSVVNKYDVSAYSSNTKINDLIIYQGGTAKPTYDPISDIYSFGGIMPENSNVAVYDYGIKTNTLITVPTWAINRGDIEYNKDNNQIIDSSKNEEKIGIDQMIKMTIYFWFEGWDADCFDVIDRNPVTLNLNFSTIDK